MKQFQSRRLLSLLTESSRVSNEEIQNAYEDFVEHVAEMCDSDTDYPALYRMLNYYRTEFDQLKSNFLYGQEKKCAQAHVLAKGIPFCEKRDRTASLETSVSRPIFTAAYGSIQVGHECDSQE